MKPVKVVVACKKKLIVQSIANSLTKDNDIKILGAINNVEQLIGILEKAHLEILIIDRQMIEELYIWKNVHPKSFKRTLRVLLITHEKGNDHKAGLPGFIPNQITFWEKGMNDLLVCFKLLRENEFLQLTPINIHTILQEKNIISLN